LTFIPVQFTVGTIKCWRCR